ncbi:MAG: hypothetical protein HYY01_05490 [Chloroflexi bacterium]|nr:hypothetical protein [Chloroflexota bacterium]
MRFETSRKMLRRVGIIAILISALLGVLMIVVGVAAGGQPWLVALLVLAVGGGSGGLIYLIPLAMVSLRRLAALEIDDEGFTLYPRQGQPEHTLWRDTVKATRWHNNVGTFSWTFQLRNGRKVGVSPVGFMPQDWAQIETVFSNVLKAPQ